MNNIINTTQNIEEVSSTACSNPCTVMETAISRLGVNTVLNQIQDKQGMNDVVADTAPQIMTSADMVDEGERAVDDAGQETDRLEKAWEQMKLSPVSYMKNLPDVFDSRLFAGISKGKDGTQYVEFCQLYSDGSFSPKMRVAQADILMSAMYKQDAKSGNQYDAGIKRKISRFKLKAYDEYFGKFRGSLADAIDIGDIMSELLKSLPTLPVYSDDDTETVRREFYYMLTEKIKTFTSQVFDNFKSYYALTEYDITDLAQYLKTNRMELLKKLREYGFLYLTPSCKGYQVNIRFKAPDGKEYTERRYCIYKIEHFAGIDETPDEDRQYNF